MGMGEPLANYDNLLKALKILNAPWGGGIGARKITISTSGLAPQIRKLADEPLQFRLAISLHGATDEVRNKIMPVNRKYPLARTDRRPANITGKQKGPHDHVRIHFDRRRERRRSIRPNRSRSLARRLERQGEFDSLQQGRRTCRGSARPK